MSDHKGFTLVEVLMVVFILSLLMAGGYSILASGKATWFTTDTNIQLQENLRKVVDRMVAELRQTQVAQLQLQDGAGVNGSDIIRFSIPIICQAGTNWINASGDVAQWGAPLSWGCTDVSCMDADGSCLALEYKYIEYRLDNQNRLLRRVLGETATLVMEDVFAQNITDLQIQVNGKVLTINVTGRQRGVDNRILTAQKSINIYLRN
jgi:prepilin-type N-terminal cleavage/methylation domain-containing protein